MLDQEEETWLFRTCVERGGAVRSVLGSPVIRITSCSTTSSPFFERFRSRSTRYVDASIHSLLDELLDDLGETSRKIFVFCNVPQHKHNPKPCSLPGLRRKETITATHAVDVVVRLHDPTDQVPNARHLRVLHTFSSMTSLELRSSRVLRESLSARRCGDDDDVLPTQGFA